MKAINKYLIAFFVAIMFDYSNLIAQCSFDIIYPNYNVYGKKGIQTKDGNLLIGGKNISPAGLQYPLEGYSLYLKKIDNCGNTVWDFFEGGGSYTDFPFLFLEELDSAIAVLKNNNWVVKVDSKGKKKSYILAIDTIETFKANSFIQLNPNNYFFAGFKTSNAAVLKIDTSGNKIFQYNYFKNSGNISYFDKAKKIGINEITLLGFEGSDILYVCIDTLGNLKSLANLKIFDTINKIGYQRSIQLNHNNTELLYSSKNGDMTYIARLNLDGSIKKDTFFNYSAVTSTEGNNDILLSAFDNVYLLDSMFNIILQSSILTGDPNGQYFTSSSFISGDSTIVAIGTKHSCAIGSPHCYYDLHVAQATIFRKIKSIKINGISEIKINKGSTQLSAAILPVDAQITNLNWSVNDTNIANVDNKGLVVAKSNGDAIVTAAAIDGSNVTATKLIKISNQSNAIQKEIANEVFFNTYPNPSNDLLNVSLKGIKSPIFEIVSCSGIKMLDFKSNLIDEEHYQIEVDNLSAGAYFLLVKSEDSGLIARLFFKQ